MDGNPTTQFPGDMPVAPPPPPEVKVRTMRSDIDEMGKNGGSLPHFHVVTVKGLTPTKARMVETAVPLAASGGTTTGTNKAAVAAVVIIAIAAIALLVYLAYRTLFAGTISAPSTGNATAALPAQNQTATSTATTSATAPFIHVSLFKKQADQTLIFTFSSGGAATSAADLQTFNQRLSALLAGADNNAHMIEIAMRTADGRGVAIGDVLAQANAPLLSAQALAHFNPDASFFVYRDANGFWPGIVLLLTPGDNWLFAKNDVQSLESSPDIANLFLAGVGAPSASGFADSTVNNTAVRAVSFPHANPPATFLYGWYQTYLIISTSQNGFTAAMKLLQPS